MIFLECRLCFWFSRGCEAEAPVESVLCLQATPIRNCKQRHSCRQFPFLSLPLPFSCKGNWWRTWALCRIWMTLWTPCPILSSWTSSQMAGIRDMMALEPLSGWQLENVLTPDSRHQSCYQCISYNHILYHVKTYRISFWNIQGSRNLSHSTLSVIRGGQGGMLILALLCGDGLLLPRQCGSPCRTSR